MTQCQFCADCPYATFPPEVESYFEFKEGSYWIYRDVSNNTFDSLYIISSSKRLGVRHCGDAHLDQRIGSKSLEMYLTINAKDLSLFLTGGDFVSNRINFGTTFSQTILNKRYENLVAVDNCCVSNTCSSYFKTCETINSSIFLINSFVFAPNIGLIKWETEKHPIYGKTTFELVRYKIVKP